MNGPLTTRLTSLLEELAAVLRELDHDHWADWMSDGAEELRAGRFKGITHVLGAYGGMGSFTDLIFEENAAGRKAERLRSNVWSLAEKIRRRAEFK